MVSGGGYPSSWRADRAVGQKRLDTEDRWRHKGHMHIDRIWRIELLGVHGWETVSTSYLENGRCSAGGSRGYAVGRYEANACSIRAMVAPCENGLAIFGRGSGSLDLSYQGTLVDGRLEGQATDSHSSVHFRSTPGMDLP